MRMLSAGGQAASTSDARCAACQRAVDVLEGGHTAGIMRVMTEATDPTPDAIASVALEVAMEALQDLRSKIGSVDSDALHAGESELFRRSRAERDEAGERGGEAPTPYFLYTVASHLLIMVAQEAGAHYLEGDRRSDPIAMAWDALVEGRQEEAADRAADLLASVPSADEARHSGAIVHHANLILGHLRLQEGDVAAAEDYLLAAGRTAGSPALNSFGPNMSLALALLRRGRVAPVLDYFGLCSSFWDPTCSKLHNWEATIQRGRIPDFMGNLVYGMGSRHWDDEEETEET